MFRSNRLLPKEKAQELDLSTRIALEARITDRRVQDIAVERFRHIETDFEAFAKRVPWRRFLFDFLGPVDGQLMLDLACGYSMSPVIFALAGARVYALDVAPKALQTVRWFAEFKGVGDRVRPVLAPGEYLPFAAGSFDLIHGSAALHHLQLEQAAPEIARVLNVRGKAGFVDPLGHNILLEFARDYVPYRNKHPEKATDHPLHMADVEAFGRCFTHCTCQSFQLVSMVGSVLHIPCSSPVRQRLESFDTLLFDLFPQLQPYARKVVTCVVK